MLIGRATGQRHSAPSVVVTSYLMFSKGTLGKILGKTLGLTMNVSCVF